MPTTKIPLPSRLHIRHRTRLQRIVKPELDPVTAKEMLSHKDEDSQSIALALPPTDKILAQYPSMDIRQLKLFIKVPVPAGDKSEARIVVNRKVLTTIVASTGQRRSGLPAYTEHMVEVPLERLSESRVNAVQIALRTGTRTPDLSDDIGFWIQTPDPDEIQDDPPPAASEPNRQKEEGRTVLFHNESRRPMELVWVDPRGIERDPVTLEPRTPCTQSGLVIAPGTFTGPNPDPRTTYPGSLFRIYLVDNDEIDNLVGFHVVGEEKEQRYFIRLATMTYDPTSREPEVITVEAGVEKLERPVEIAGLLYHLKTVLRFQGTLFSKRGLEKTLNGIDVMPAKVLERPEDGAAKQVIFRIHDIGEGKGRYEVHEQPLGAPSSDPDDPSRWRRFRDNDGTTGIQRVVEAPFYHEREFNYSVIARPVDPGLPLALASDPVDIVGGSGGTHGDINR